MSAKELHDKWLEQKPEGASHPKDCPFCLVEEPTGGAGKLMSEDNKTFTSEELAAAVALAVQPLKDKISELESKDAEAEVSGKIADAKAELETKVSDLQTAFDVKVAELATATQALEDVKAYLADVQTKADEAAAVEARKASRLEEVNENATYSEEYIAERADRWAAMSDEEFAAFVADLQAAGATKKDTKDDKIPADTRLKAGSEKANQDEPTTTLGSVLELRRAGHDARRIH